MQPVWCSEPMIENRNKNRNSKTVQNFRTIWTGLESNHVRAETAVYTQTYVVIVDASVMFAHVKLGRDYFSTFT